MRRCVVTAALATVVALSASAAAVADSSTTTGSKEVTMLALGCDEHILFTGTEHFVLHVTVTPSGERQIESIRFVDANLTGVGETTGTIYRLVSVLGQTRIVVHVEGEERTQISTIEQTFLIHGGGQLYVAKAVQHITHTPDGEITAEVNEFRFECK